MVFTMPNTLKMNKPLKKRNVFSILFICVCFATSLFYPCEGALANVRPVGADQLSVLRRENPAYSPIGLRAGDFILHSGITTGWQYTDNVYARKDAISDYRYTVTPSLTINSDFIRHSLGFSLSGEKGFYNKVKSENYTDYAAQVNGRVDLSGQTTLPFSLSYVQDHYRRGSEDERAGTEPTVFNLVEGTAGVIRKGQTMMVQVIGNVKDYTFKKINSAAGLIDNSDQDRTNLSLYTSAGIQDDAIIAPFVYSELTKIEYDQKTSNSGVMRSSSGYEFGAGSVLNFSKVTRASFNLGYLSREYDDARFAEVSGFTYGIDLVWEPSTLTSFELKGNRSIEETIALRASSSVASSLGLSVTYELFPNVILNPNVGYKINEYEGIDRTVETANAGLSVNYKMNQNLWLSTSYGYITQNESGRDAGSREYDANTLNLSLKLHF